MYFSIIVPVYNVEKYLAECVDSVLRQTFTDFELILVDDGSKDNSPGICDEYAKKDTRIEVIHQQNGGLSDARNAGTSVAGGKYIIYIDSDDFILTDRFLHDVYDRSVKSSPDIILYKYQKYYDDEKRMEECKFSLDYTEGLADAGELLLETVKHDAYYGMAWIKTIRREIIIANGINFEKGLLGEDMEWYFHLLTVTKSIDAIDASYIAYRQRGGSITSSQKLKNLTDFIYILEKWNSGIEQADITETMKQALRGALAKYYSNLLIVYARLNDKGKKQTIKQIKALHSLLDNSKSKRPETIRKVYKLLGFTGTIMLLKVFDKVKG